MAYGTALEKGWAQLAGFSDKDECFVVLLNEAYEVHVRDKRVIMASSKAPAKDFVTILILHYLSGSLKRAFAPSGEWVSFKEIESGQFYYPAFYEGAIKPILKKYGADPQGLAGAADRLGGKAVKMGDAAIEIAAFSDIPVRIVLWKSDEEFGPEATMLFDKNITKIFPTEDIAVLARIIAHKI